MVNKREILPQSVFTAEGVRTAKFLEMSEMYGYFFNNEGSVATFHLIEEADNGTTTLDDGTIVANPKSYNRIYGATIKIPTSTFNQWTTNDDTIFEYVATTLGLTIVQNV